MKHLRISISPAQSTWAGTRPFSASDSGAIPSLVSEAFTSWIGGNSQPRPHLLSRLRAAARRTILAAFIVLCVAWVSAWAQAPAALPPLDPELQAGLASHKAGRFKEAIDIYSAAIKKNPKSAEAFDWRGMAYDEINEPDKALEDFNEAIKLAPDYPDAYNNRGEIFRKKKMYREASGDFRKALQLDGNFAEARFNMGLVLEAQKQNDQAAKEFLQYIKLKPDAADKTAVLEKIKALQAAAPAPAPAAPAGPPPGAAPTPAPPGAPAKPAPPPPPPPGAKPAAPPGMQPAKPGPPAPVPGMAPMPGMDALPIPPEYMAALVGLGIFLVIIPIVFYIFFAVMLFFIAKKTNTSPAWLAFIPIANTVLMVMIAGKPIWWVALLFLSVLTTPVSLLLGPIDPTDGIIVMALNALLILVPLAAWLFVCLGIADARGKSVIWGVLLFIPCTNPIALGYLGLSK